MVAKMTIRKIYPEQENCVVEYNMQTWEKKPFRAKEGDSELELGKGTVVFNWGRGRQSSAEEEGMGQQFLAEEEGRLKFVDFSLIRRAQFQFNTHYFFTEMKPFHFHLSKSRVCKESRNTRLHKKFLFLVTKCYLDRQTLWIEAIDCVIFYLFNI